MLSPRQFQTLALLAVAGILGYVIFIPPGDPLEDATSGVVANLVVHAAIIDAGTGEVASTASVEFEPATQVAAAFAGTASLGYAFQPLASADEILRNGCTNGLANLITQTPNSQNAWLLKGDLGANAIADVRISTYLAGNYIGAFGATARTYSVGLSESLQGKQVYTEGVGGGYCLSRSNTVTIGGGTTSTTPSPTPPPVGDATATLARIPITIAGSVTTKNLATPVRLQADVEIKTAAGKTITKSLPEVNVPAAGGEISGLGNTFEIPKADIGTGRTTMKVVVIATSTDVQGVARSDTGQVDLNADTDYQGSVKISVRPASFTMSLGMPDGTTLKRTRSLVPADFSLGLG